ncbi:MAG TPA: hypothetical protein VF535_09715 [Allosphingosinicella sp.]|jgi:hypothetical protein
MVDVRKIEATIVTSDTANAQSDGRVYLGICGREFRCNRGDDDFERAMERTYHFGEKSNVIDPHLNNPASPQLTVADADRYPTYVRFEDTKNNHWKVRSVKVRLNGEGPEYVNAISELFLGYQAGAFCYLKKR